MMRRQEWRLTEEQTHKQITSEEKTEEHEQGQTQNSKRTATDEDGQKDRWSSEATHHKETKMDRRADRFIEPQTAIDGRL